MAAMSASWAPVAIECHVRTPALVVRAEMLPKMARPPAAQPYSLDVGHLSFHA
jgi:hypothetical protein